MQFRGSGVVSAEIACMALQPVLNSLYRRHRGEPWPAVEIALKHVGRGAFAKDGIEIFAEHISAGHRPVVVSSVGPEHDRVGARPTTER